MQCNQDLLILQGSCRDMTYRGSEVS